MLLPARFRIWKVRFEAMSRSCPCAVHCFLEHRGFRQTVIRGRGVAIKRSGFSDEQSHRIV